MLVCPHHPYMLVRADNPSIRRPRPCDSYSCENCRLAKVHERTRIMTWGAQFAGDARLLTLTLLPPEWQKARMQVRDLVRRLRKKYSIEMAWAIEANPRQTGYHAHAIQHGTWMHNKTVQRMWGGRHVDIRRIKPGKSGYATKCAMVSGYTTKCLDHHLEINGGRAVHMTRGYLHGLTSREVCQLMSQGHEWRVMWATTDDREAAKSGKWPGYSDGRDGIGKLD